MSGWVRDPLLAGYQARSWSIPGAQLAEGEPEVALTATLVRRGAPRHDRAVLYLHGWNDYFFQTHLADWFDAQGFDFYAVELRRYGRNLVPGLYAGYVTDLAHYESELDQAVALIHDDHPGAPITFMGHSTGGLTGVLWASRRPGLLAGVILNSPWLDMQGSPALWRMLSPVAAAISVVSPLAELGSGVDTGFYRRSMRADEDGEWDWDLDLKSHPAFIHRWGWGRAVLAGHARVAAGLHIDTPVLVMTSDRSDFSRTWDESMHEADLVLDVDRIAAAAPHLGPLVTIRRVTGGVHDLMLSREPVRRQIFDEMARWIDAYVRPDGLIGRYHENLRHDGTGTVRQQTPDADQGGPEGARPVAARTRRGGRPSGGAPGAGGADIPGDGEDDVARGNQRGWWPQRRGRRGSWFKWSRPGQVGDGPDAERPGHEKNRS